MIFPRATSPGLLPPGYFPPSWFGILANISLPLQTFEKNHPLDHFDYSRVLNNLASSRLFISTKNTLLLGTTRLFIFEEKFKLEWLKLRILFICLLIKLSVCLARKQAILGISFILICTHKTLLIICTS